MIKQRPLLVLVMLLSGCAAAARLPGGGLLRQAEVLEQSSLEATRSGALQRAAGLEQQALDLYRRVDATQAMAASLNRLGRLRVAMGADQAAARNFAEAYELALVQGDGAGQAAAANNLGSVARLAGDLVLANSRYTEAIESESAPETTRATALNNRALLRFAAGDRTRARTDLTQALRLDRSIEDRQGEALRLRNLAAVDLEEGALDSAIRGLGRAHAMDVRRQDPAAIARDLEALAVARWMQGEDRRLALSERRRSYNIDVLQRTVPQAERQREAIILWCLELAADPVPVDCLFESATPDSGGD